MEVLFVALVSIERTGASTRVAQVTKLPASRFWEIGLGGIKFQNIPGRLPGHGLISFMMGEQPPGPRCALALTEAIYAIV